MSQKRMTRFLLILSLFLLLAVTAAAPAASDITHEEVATAEREHTYTTAEAVAAGRNAAERYWLSNYVIWEVAAAEREFTYTTAAAVEQGQVAAHTYCTAAIAC